MVEGCGRLVERAAWLVDVVKSVQVVCTLRVLLVVVAVVDWDGLVPEGCKANGQTVVEYVVVVMVVAADSEKVTGMLVALVVN